MQLNLTRFGDPVDPTGFYNMCGSKGVHQLRAKYDRQVYINGFQIRGLALRDDVFMRVLAKTPRMRADRLVVTDLCVLRADRLVVTDLCVMRGNRFVVTDLCVLFTDFDGLVLLRCG